MCDAIGAAACQRQPADSHTLKYAAQCVVHLRKV